ncbi:MAG: hypothetical protein RL459_1159 [Pseudomonadota bacterium]
MRCVSTGIIHLMTLIDRRQLLALGACLGFPLAPLMAQPRKTGRLVVIGGAEDRLRDRTILRRFVDLCGGPSARLLVFTAASSDQDASWQGYEPVFRELGVDNCSQLAVRSVEHANDPDLVNQLLSADGIFMTGGDQRRLMNLIWETDIARAMHTAFHVRGCCIGGTSAGAAAMSRLMLAEGTTPRLPEKDAAILDLGLGFVSRAIIDQHFSERRRLGRLLSVLAQRPDMLGIGIDEDTALVIERAHSVEVIGKGAVTLLDARSMTSNFADIESNERLELLGVRLHLLPAGYRYSVVPGERGARRISASLLEAVELLVAPGPVRG